MTPSDARIKSHERRLAKLERRLRHTTPPSDAWETLADAYITRPVGHRLDNVDRALLSLRLAMSSATPSRRAILCAKIGHAWYSRVQHLLKDHPPIPPTLLHSHLVRARTALDYAISAFEESDDVTAEVHDVVEASTLLQKPLSNSNHNHSPESNHISSSQNQHQPSHYFYADALLCRALVYDTLYHTLDGCAAADTANTPSATTPCNRRLKRDLYVFDCIHSLEKLLAVTPDLPSSSTKRQSIEPIQNYQSRQLFAPPRQISHAKALMCLARAYSNASDASKRMREAVMMLASVDKVLEGAEQGAEDGVQSEVRQLRMEARDQKAALTAAAATDNRCVMC